MVVWCDVLGTRCLASTQSGGDTRTRTNRAKWSRATRKASWRSHGAKGGDYGWGKLERSEKENRDDSERVVVLVVAPWHFGVPFRYDYILHLLMHSLTHSLTNQPAFSFHSRSNS